MTNFERWDREFRSQNLFAFNNDDNALLWLKVRAVCRGKQIGQFCRENSITLVSKGIARQNVELFERLEQEDNAVSLLDNFLRVKTNDWYKAIGIDDTRLKEDLYKIQHYAWGGDQNNSLDKHLVSRYVKVVSHYDELLKRQGEIALNAWNYVQTSWYNNWTSYLIESLFKRHHKVVAAVGEIKSVDFFIGKYPIDLKVTYFPNQFMEQQLRKRLGSSEISWLRKKAKELSITADSTQSVSQQLYTLTEKLSELGFESILDEMKKNRKEVIDEAQKNPVELMKWLYENQGEMRFGAENRLFIILVDSTNIGNSWKMKRAFNIIEPKVKTYLDSFNDCSLKRINFIYKKNEYKSLADTIFIVK